MKTTLASTVFLFALFGAGQMAQAQSMSLVSFGDFLNDYELYLADPDTTDWYIVWTMEDGSIVEEGPYQTHDSAQDRLTWYFLGGYERSYDVEILELTKPPQWEYFGTFDTSAEANDMKWYFRNLGLLASIRSVIDPGSVIHQSYRSGQQLTSEKVTRNRLGQ